MRQAAIIILLCAGILARAGSGKMDSLRTRLLHAASDTEKVSLLIGLSQCAPAGDSAIQLTYARQALALAEHLMLPKYTMNALLNMGRICTYRLNDCSAGIRYFGSYEKIAVESKDTLRQVEALGNLMNSYDRCSDQALALACGNRALGLRPSIESSAFLLSNAGRIYLEVADYEKAIDYYSRSLMATEQYMIFKGKNADINDTIEIAIIEMNLGEIYGKLKEYSKAIEYYDKAIYTGATNVHVALAALVDKAGIYGKLKRYPDAIAAYRQALVLDRQIKMSHTTAEIFANMAGLYIETGDVKTAQTYADSANRKAEDNRQNNMMPRINIIQARLLGRAGNNRRAVEYLTDAVATAHRLGLLESENEALGALSETYKALHMPEQALEAYQRYIATRDSILNIDKAKEITRMGAESEYTTIRISDSVKTAHQNELYDAQIQRQKLVNRSQLAGVAALLLVAFFIYRNYAQQKKANVVISKARDEIHREQQVSEGLLLNILPEAVAKELKARGDVAPQMFDSVTVLFTDFKGFTQLSEELSPQALVTEINQCFTAFDGVMQKYGVEKIKTIGDAYMAAGGLPVANDTHPADVVNAALEIQQYMRRHKEQKEAAGELYFEIRIGVHTGPVVAGVVGVKKFAYDIWGDTVNTASRMESSGAAGMVNISQATYDLVKDRFKCEYRGEIAAKGKGMMNMYYVG